MNSQELIGSSYYDLEVAKKRLREAELNHKRLQAQMRPFYSGRSKFRPSAAAKPPRGVLQWLLIAASLACVCWLCSSVLALYEQNNRESQEILHAAACQNNQLNHAGAAYCFDGRRIVHTINPDGTSEKPGFDWSLNEAARHQAEVEEDARVGNVRHAKLPK